jgi:hypothetical protein
MATMALRKRLAALELRRPSARFGVVEVPHCHPSEQDVLIERIMADLPEHSAVCILPATCASDAEWDQLVAWHLEWQAANEAWDAAVAEGRARRCEPCGKRFIRPTRICPGCNQPTVEGH